MRVPRIIDVGVRDLVAALNQIPGVTTRASCEGARSTAARHHHGDLAYVLLEHPMPLRLQEYLCEHLDQAARVEDDAIYSRWPRQNAEFVARLATALHGYLSDHAIRPEHSVRWPLSRVRACLARGIAQSRDFAVAVCTACADLVFVPHQPSAHRAPTVLQIPQAQEARWFLDFLAQRGNAIDPALLTIDGSPRLIERAIQGDFGQAFRRRWLRYRAFKLAQLGTRQLRDGIAALRHDGAELDFYYTDTHAVVIWPRT